MSEGGSGRRRRPGTAARLALLHAAALLAVLAASVFALLRTTTAGVQSLGLRQLDAEVVSFQQAAAHRPVSQPLLTFAAAYLRQHAVPDGNLVAFGVPGRGAVANAGGSRIAAAPAVAPLLRRVPVRSTVHHRSVGRARMELLAAPVVPASGRPGVLVLGVDLASLEPATAATIRLAIAEAAIAFVAGVASAYLLLRSLLRRIGRVTAAADRIGRGRLAERLGGQPVGDEVGNLAASFDAMLDRIEEAVTAQHELLSDVSHQLRTPLTVARGHLEVLLRTGRRDGETAEAVVVAIDELDRMSRLVERLLALGRAREPVRPDLRPVDLRAFLGDLYETVQVLAPRVWLLDPVPDIVLWIDEEEVRGALLNLVDNAVRATGPGDTVALSADADTGGEVVWLGVEDSGPGIPEGRRAAVLDRFSRPGAETGGGTGLGLAIVGAVCRAHGGEVTIGDSRLGGARVAMRLRALQVRTGTVDGPAPAYS